MLDTPRFTALVLLIAVALAPSSVAGGGGEDDGNPWPTVRVQLEIPAALGFPTVLAETVPGANPMLEKIGGNSYRIVNFDASVALQVTLVARGGVGPDLWPDLTVQGGADGPDPMPTVTITWSDGPFQFSEIIDEPGESSTCSTCDGLEIDGL